MGTVITVAQQKGGAGKTTLAAHLAIAFRHAGRRVATLDIDPQGSLTAWIQVRRDVIGDPGVTHSQITGWRTTAEVERLSRDHDVVVVDSPPHAETEAKIAVRAASLVVVPVQPSPMDVWATKPTLDVARAEKVPILLVLNRVPPRGRLVEDLVGKIAALGVPLATARIGNRVGYASALAEGRSVIETGRNTPAAP